MGEFLPHTRKNGCWCVNGARWTLCLAANEVAQPRIEPRTVIVGPIDPAWKPKRLAKLLARLLVVHFIEAGYDTIEVTGKRSRDANPL